MRLNVKRLIHILFRCILTAALILILAAFVLFLRGCSYDSKLERHFNQIAKGMTKEHVLSIMGKPNSIGKCGELGGIPDTPCYREYLYKPLLAISGDTMAVFFDSQGRVVGKYYYRSP